MKFIAITLILVTALLTMKPGGELSLFEKQTVESCCEETTCEVPDEPVGEDDGCCGDFCNPFQVCCSHIVFFPTYNYTEMESALPALDSVGNSIVPSVLSKFESDFWQPPRLA